MSIEKANEFRKHVQSNHQFRDQLSAAKSDQEISNLIIGAGYHVTAEELKTSLAAWSAVDGRELSDAELETVAGGGMGSGNFTLMSTADLRAGVAVVGRSFKGG